MSRSRLVACDGGVHIHVVAHGSDHRHAPPVVVLHGFTGDGTTMRHVVEPLASARRVLAVDLVGHGRSDAPHDVDPYRMEAVVGQVLAVCRSETDGPVDVVGYSMGGRIALSLAVCHPGAVRALALIGASAGIADPAARADRLAADHALADQLEARGLEWFVDHWMALPLFASQQRLGHEVLAGHRRQRLRNRVHGLANSLRGTGTGAQPAWHDRLGGVTARVTCVAGELDPKYCAVAAELAALTPGAAARFVVGAGHAAHLEAPGEVAQVIGEALA